MSKPWLIWLALPLVGRAYLAVVARLSRGALHLTPRRWRAWLTEPLDERQRLVAIFWMFAFVIFLGSMGNH